PPRNPEVRCTWRIILMFLQKNDARYHEERTRKRVTETRTMTLLSRTSLLFDGSHAQKEARLPSDFRIASCQFRLMNFNLHPVISNFWFLFSRTARGLSRSAFLLTSYRTYAILLWPNTQENPCPKPNPKSCKAP